MRKFVERRHRFPRTSGGQSDSQGLLKLDFDGLRWNVWDCEIASEIWQGIWPICFLKTHSQRIVLALSCSREGLRHATRCWTNLWHAVVLKIFITPFQAIRQVPELRPLAGFRVNSLDCKALADHEPRMYQDGASWRSFIFKSCSYTKRLEEHLIPLIIQAATKMVEICNEGGICVSILTSHTSNSRLREIVDPCESDRTARGPPG